jgi:rubrerythrin
MSLERDGYRFYTQVAGQASSKRGKEMFLDLAMQEVDHLRILLAEYRALESGEGWIPYEEALGRDLSIDPDHPDLPGEEPPDPLPVFTPDREVSLEGDIAALEYGLETEEITRELYQQGLESTDDPAAVEAYRFLVHQEEKHYQLLQDTRDYLTENQTWWDDEQYPFFTG